MNNAFYKKISNSIHFPAAWLDGVFFTAGRPKYMNYGAMGMIVGHEITHGFDDQGSQWDADGECETWSNIERFEVECIVSLSIILYRLKILM